MPEPSKSSINTKDPKYGNGANAESVDRATDACFTNVDQLEQRDEGWRRVAKIRSGNKLKTATKEPKGRQW
jgi:hypothetical protein